MAGGSGSRPRADLRKKARRHFHYTAKILADKKGPPRLCLISDIAEGGARLVLENDGAPPDRFVLLLGAHGEARRQCRIVWRKELTVGVAFIGAET
jgi:PilZ domain